MRYSKSGMDEDARRIALKVLNGLESGKKTLDDLIETAHADPPLSRRDRAFLQALVYGVLRWRGFLDNIIKHFSRIRISKIDPAVLNILRLGLFQIIFLSKVPSPAAVHTSVEMAKSSPHPWTGGYVNALLRNAAGNHQKVPLPDPQIDPAGSLSVKKSFPRWLAEKWIKRMGYQEAKALCDAINRIPPITIRCNTLKTTRQKLMEALEKQTKHPCLQKYSPDAISFFSPMTSIPEMRIFRKGWFQVQDEASQLIAFLLNPQPGETVLDACAGLGGKTGHIAQRMKDSGRIVAVDKNEKKLLRLDAEMQRLGVSIVRPFPCDLNLPVSRDFFGMFDRVLLDAPCSGLGVLRRNPDAKWRRSEKRLAADHKRQLKFLEHLSGLVKPSGRLVYAVCSTEPEEGEDVIRGFLNRHPEYMAENAPQGLPDAARFLSNDQGYLKTFPHIHHMDGFFAVGMKRTK